MLLNRCATWIKMVRRPPDSFDSIAFPYFTLFAADHWRGPRTVLPRCTTMSALP